MFTFVFYKWCKNIKLEICPILRYYATHGGNSFPTFQDNNLPVSLTDRLLPCSVMLRREENSSISRQKPDIKQYSVKV